MQHVLQGARQTVELPYNDRIALPQMVEAAVQLRPIPSAAGRGLLEQASATGDLERLRLQGVVLFVALGDPRIAEQSAAAGQSGAFRKRSFMKDAKPSSGGALLGYDRVSKGDEQNNVLQTKALKAAGCRRVFEEAASGGRWDRPELLRMLDQLGDGDTVVVWKLDRLSRSLKDVLHIMERISNTGAGFRSITENIDTTTPAGRMMMQMVGAFAEFERAMIRERTSAGLAAARAEGRIGGRRKKLDAGKRYEIAESVVSGRKSGAEMARLYNISAPTVSRIVAQHRTGLS
jgi:DNA invertase Pin-like site-specific DNA recombinase